MSVQHALDMVRAEYTRAIGPMAHVLLDELSRQMATHIELAAINPGARSVFRTIGKGIEHIRERHETGRVSTVVTMQLVEAEGKRLQDLNAARVFSHQGGDKVLLDKGVEMETLIAERDGLLTGVPGPDTVRNVKFRGADGKFRTKESSIRLRVIELDQRLTMLRREAHQIERSQTGRTSVDIRPFRVLDPQRRVPGLEATLERRITEVERLERLNADEAIRMEIQQRRRETLLDQGFTPRTPSGRTKPQLEATRDKAQAKLDRVEERGPRRVRPGEDETVSVTEFIQARIKAGDEVGKRQAELDLFEASSGQAFIRRLQEVDERLERAADRFAAREDAIGAASTRGALAEENLRLAEQEVPNLVSRQIDRIEIAGEDVRRRVANDGVALTFVKQALFNEKEAKLEALKEIADPVARQKAAGKLDGEFKAAQRDLEALRLRLLRKPLNVAGISNKFFAEAVRAMTRISFLRIGGGFTIAAIPDIMNIITVNGFKNTMRTFRALQRDISLLSKDEMSRSLIALDMVAGTTRSNMIHGMEEGVELGRLSGPLDR